MIKPRRKMIVGIILMLILSMGFMGSIMMFRASSDSAALSERNIS